MTNLVPHDIEEWMRTMERRYVDLATRRASQTALAQSTPRWRSRPPNDASINNTTLTNVGYSTVGSAPDHDVGNPAFVSYQTPGGEPRYVFATAGLYLVRASMQWNGAANGTRKLHLFRNADTVPRTTVEMPNAGATAGVHVDVEDVIAFNVNDYLRLAAWQNSGGAVTFIASGIAGQFADSTLTIVPLGAYSL